MDDEINALDAAVFSGPSLHEKASREKLRNYLARWECAMVEFEQATMAEAADKYVLVIFHGFETKIVENPEGHYTPDFENKIVYISEYENELLEEVHENVLKHGFLYIDKIKLKPKAEEE